MAIGILHQLSERGLDCPRDVSVTSLGDLGPAAYATPAISAIRLPLREAGITGCERFIQKLRHELTEVSEKLPTQLVARASTGPAVGAVSNERGRQRR